MKTLQDLFLHELAVMYDAEHQLIQALPKMAMSATCDTLERTLLSHLKETEDRVKQLEQVFECFGRPASAKTCTATMGLLYEGAGIAEAFQHSTAINAALIAVTQRIEHHAMASYDGLHTWARLQGNHEAAGILQAILNEVTAANATFGRLAQAGGRQEAPDQGGKTPAPAAAEKTDENGQYGAPTMSAHRNRIFSR